MVNGVVVNNEGMCSLLKINCKKNTFTQNGVSLYTHYEDNDFKLLSKFKVEDVLRDDVALLQFSFPPPLNSYVYPENIIVMKLKDSKSEDLSCNELVEYCAKFKAEMFEIKNELAIYDVPLDETIYEDDCQSEVDEEESHDSDENEEEDMDDDEDFWEDDDPVVS